MHHHHVQALGTVPVRGRAAAAERARVVAAAAPPQRVEYIRTVAGH